ncbi:hypothetical protein ACJRO7_014401, partial [Eucalyptus globulus]
MAEYFTAKHLKAVPPPILTTVIRILAVTHYYLPKLRSCCLAKDLRALSVATGHESYMHGGVHVLQVVFNNTPSWSKFDNQGGLSQDLQNSQRPWELAKFVIGQSLLGVLRYLARKHYHSLRA